MYDAGPRWESNMGIPIPVISSEGTNEYPKP